MKKVLKIFLWLIIIAIVGGTMYYLYSKSQEKPVIYETETAVTTDIVKKTVATGSIVPRKEIEIKPQVSGIVQELYVVAGDIVEKGQLIAKVKIIPNMINLNEAESRLEKAKINLRKNKSEYARSKKLFTQEVIPESEFLTVEAQYDQAKEDVFVAENNLKLIKEGVRKDAAKASNTLVRSTISGMVLDVPIEIGNSVIESNTFNAGTTIASVADMSEMIFEGKVDETEVGKIKEGMNLILTIGAVDQEQFVAQLEYISPKGVAENGAIQFEIKASVELRDDVFIRAGYSANADIVLQKHKNVLAINEGLLQFDDNDSTYVEVETTDQVFERRDVKTGLSDGINIEILSGLSKEDKIKVVQ